LKLVYARLNREIDANRNTILKEMVEFVFREYITNLGDKSRKIPKSLSSKKMKTKNPVQWPSKRDEYHKEYNAALKLLDEEKIEELLKGFNLDATGKQVLDILKEQLKREKTSSSVLRLKNLKDKPLINRILENPDSTKKVRDKKRKGFSDNQFKQYTNKMKFSKKNSKPEKNTVVESRILEFVEKDVNIPISAENDEDSKVGFLYGLGYRPIRLIEIAYRSGKKQKKTTEGKGRIIENKNLNFKGFSAGDKEFTGGNLLSSGSGVNNLKLIFESQYLDKKRPDGTSNAKYRTSLLYGIKFAERIKIYVKNAIKHSKPLKEDILDYVLSPKDQAFNNKYFNPPKYQQGPDYETYATPSDEGTEAFPKIKGEGDAKEITKIPELDSQGKQKDINGVLQYHIKREGKEKVVGKKGTVLFYDLDKLNDSIQRDTGGKTIQEYFDSFRLTEDKKQFKPDFKKFEDAVEIIRSSNRKSSEKANEKYKEALAQYKYQLDNMVKSVSSDIVSREEDIKAEEELMESFIEEKVKELTSSAKKIVQTRQLPKEFKDLKYRDPKTGVDKKWTKEEFINYLASGGFGPKAKKGEDKTLADDLEERSTNTTTINIPIAQQKNKFTSEEAKEAFRSIRTWVIKNFSEPLRDMELLYRFKFKVSKVMKTVEKDGKKTIETSYIFDIAELLPTHEITHKALFPYSMGERGGSRITNQKSSVNRSKDTQSINAFINSVNTNVSKIESALLRGN